MFVISGSSPSCPSCQSRLLHEDMITRGHVADMTKRCSSVSALCNLTTPQLEKILWQPSFTAEEAFAGVKHVCFTQLEEHGKDTYVISIHCLFHA